MRARAVPLVIAALALVAVGLVVLARTDAEQTDVGVVVDVDSAGLTEVRAFTLRAADGRQTTYRVGRLENGAEFPPSHLAEHLATGEPVRVFYRDEGGTRVAYRLEDASSG